MLIANGCNVIGIDLDESRCELAKSFGAATICSRNTRDTVKEVLLLTDHIGADGVIISASTKSDQLIKNAAEMSRKRGRIVLLGVAGLNIDRSDFYEKELTFQVSCSYGPGRYDPQYEVVEMIIQ